jgi:hypothetical protein
LRLGAGDEQRLAGSDAVGSFNVVDLDDSLSRHPEASRNGRQLVARLNDVDKGTGFRLNGRLEAWLGGRNRRRGRGHARLGNQQALTYPDQMGIIQVVQVGQYPDRGGEAAGDTAERVTRLHHVDELAGAWLHGDTGLGSG